MSMASYEPDRDWGDENAYEASQGRYGSDLCERCGLNVALPDEDWCSSCTLEIETALAEAEEAA